ncbi:MAG: pyruvate ferredoxin oxidoreductase [Candidatus Helarchaeota archaeon]|nr:pyruvate ferredoxin oxidoreductase [Candidatus Helarchaeota archaeon]
MKLLLKDMCKKEELLSGGHRACTGCIPANVLRQVLLAADNPVVVTCATGCMEVVTTIFPYTAWKVPFIHSAFENSAATISGVEVAYRALKKKGKIKDEINFIAIGGDGGTYDIGLQALSGALERGHKFLYVCYDNEAYMNTGIQRSGATPLGAATSTSPVGSVIPGKKESKKDLTTIVTAHKIPYSAQTSPHNWKDLARKVKTALAADGPSFLNILSPCYRGWRFLMEEGIEICRLAVDTCIWPLFEIENGNWKLNYKPKEKKPVEEYLKLQGRFRHLFREENKHIIEEMQAEVDKNWEDLLKKCDENQ